MSTGTLVSVDEYLHTNYDPDRDYVDGEILERNLGEKTHSAIQGNLIYCFRLRRGEWGILAYPEQRVQVAPTRFRVPDVTVVKISQEQGEVFQNPPFLCIEILSKDDTMEYMQEKIDDYLRFGVPYVWIISPRNRKGYIVTTDGMVEAKSGILETKNPAISIPLADLFD